MVSRCSRRVIVGRLLTRHGIEGRRRWWCLPRILDVDSQSVYVYGARSHRHRLPFFSPRVYFVTRVIWARFRHHRLSSPSLSPVS